MFKDCGKCGTKFNPQTVRKCPFCRELYGKPLQFRPSKNRASAEIKSFLGDMNAELRKSNNRYGGLLPGQTEAR